MKGRSTYLALGDSYTIGECVTQRKSFPYQLQAFPDMDLQLEDPHVIAKTGWTCEELADGINQADLQGKYDFVTLLIGVNDQYRGHSVSDYRTLFSDLLRKAIALCASGRSKVFVLSIPDWSETPFCLSSDREPALVSAEIDLFNAVNKELAQVEGVQYIDITPISRLGRLNPDLVAGDGLHPSAKMYEAWVKLLAPKVLDVLK